MSEETIEKLLLDVYGYRRVHEFIHLGRREKGSSLREFLEGTIIGTFRRNVVGETSDYERRINYPGISKIKEANEANVKYIHEGRRKELPYHLPNMGYFEGMDCDDIEDFLIARVMPLFPNTELIAKKGKTKSYFSDYTINTTDIGINVVCSSRNNSKLILLEFEAPKECVKFVNDTVKKYYEILHAIKYRK